MTWVARNLNERKNCFFGCDGGVSKGKQNKRQKIKNKPFIFTLINPFLLK